jgi:DNA-binding NtrC family response regulator
MASIGAVSVEESLYWQGRMREADAACVERLGDSSLPPETTVSVMLIQGMAAFDSGRVRDSLLILEKSREVAEHSAPGNRFQTCIALFSRIAQFQSPEEAVGLLAEVRQSAHKTGTASSIGSLHLVVARLEAIRGQFVSARRHLEIGRRLLAGSSQTVHASVHLVDAGLEAYSGNLVRAKGSANKGLAIAQLHSLKPLQAGCLTNLAYVLLLSGIPKPATELLQAAIALCRELPVIRFSALDVLAQSALLQKEVSRCGDLLDQCEQVRRSHSLPARSWYDLAHQITRCSYHETLSDWDTIVDIANSTIPEVDRRQYRAVQTSLLCAKARAQAHQSEHREAESTLELALRACPRGAVDPLIVLEASKALCASLRGDSAAGQIHFDRARAGCESIGHRYHERWVTRLQERTSSRHRAAVSPRRDLDVTSAALLLTDVSTILGAGHSVDLLGHRVASLLKSTTLRPRVSVESHGNCEYQPDPSASWDTQPDNSARIRVQGSDRRIDIRVAQVQSIEEFSLLKSVADVVQVGIARTSGGTSEDTDQNLWPLAASVAGEDAVFRSPRMVELLKIALKLASTNLPVLITGETGTGKEVFARLIHDNSRWKRGQFIAFNCGTVPPDMLESQLFGYRRGAFTGATDSFAGMIRSAEQGTLFLDEVGDMDLLAQPKLLRFLENREIQPLGDGRPTQVAVRLVAATNINIDSQVQAGRFRQDLMYRLGGAVLALPPLRERKDEIPALASFFLAKASADCGRAGVKLGDDFVAALLLYDWPGNIRELSNEIRRAVALADDGERLGVGHLAPAIARVWGERPVAIAPLSGDGPVISVRLDQTLAQAVSDLEERFIAHALQSSSGRVAEAADMLGLSRKGLFLKRRRRGLVTGQNQRAAADG